MKKLNRLENMMVDIVEEGSERIAWEIEAIKNPIQRFQERDIYYKALEKLEEEKKS